MRPTTPSPQVTDLLTGHERRGPSWCWRPRGTATPLLVHTLAGHGVLRTEDTDGERLSAGDTVLWRAGATQDFGCTEEAETWEIVWCHFRPREHWQDWFNWPHSEQGASRIQSPPGRTRAHVTEAMLEMDASVRSLSPHATDFGLNALEQALLWLRGTTTGGIESDDRIDEAVLFIAHRLAGPLTVPMIADAVQLSVSRFSHLFREKVGVSPARFVELRRLERAQTLLASTSMTVGGVARATGFTSQFYFATRFQEVHGSSPSRWRRQAVERVTGTTPSRAPG